ncbi:MAG: MAPEG family protein [Burkholderiaceae bacterium]
MDKTQHGVARGMGSALAVAVAVFLVARQVTFFNSEAPDLWFRMKVAALSSLLPTLTLFACIARLARHRFFTPEDIQGSAESSGTRKAQILQSLLQNTLEQGSVALPVYAAVSLLGSNRLLALVPAAAAMFVVGRILFFIGYAKGAPFRAFGFALTFYPTVLLLLIAVALGLSSVV